MKTSKKRGPLVAPFLLACHGRPVRQTPVWLMRQAGRYMKEYRELRARVGFMELCLNPGLCTEVAVHAARVLDVDAAILFSDLLVVTPPMGFPVEYVKGGGPVISRPIARPADVERVRVVPPVGPLGKVLEAVRMTRRALPPGLPLIGFAGAPFTLASYLIEGGSSRNFLKTKSFMLAYPAAWNALLNRIVRVVAPFLRAQAGAGADALQIFDSWAGCLSPADYARFVLPHSRRLIRAVGRRVPVIHFATGSTHLLELVRRAGGDVIGLDWHIRLDEARRRLGRTPVQGNLDPATLFGPFREVRAQAGRILRENGGRPGHIFNLGHGIMPGTPVDNVRALVDTVHELSRRN